MSLELQTISLETESQSLTCFKEVKNWLQDHSTTVKTALIAGIVLSGITLIACPFAFPQSFSIRGGAICIGIGSGFLAGLLPALVCQMITSASSYLSSEKIAK